MIGEVEKSRGKAVQIENFKILFSNIFE